MTSSADMEAQTNGVRVVRANRPLGPADGPRVSVVTLGCDKNTVDSERIAGALAASGARVLPRPSDAEVAIINTCGFIDAAKEESVETILEAAEMKARGDLRAVVVVGCLVERHRRELEAELPEVDLFLGLSQTGSLIPSLRKLGLLDEEPSTPLMERPLRLVTSDTPHTSFLKVSEGCDHSCAFCAIPLMRGLHRSHPVAELVSEARGLGEAGVREINVVSQDTTWYGRDLRRKDREAPLLPELLRALLAGTDVEWYRLFYMYPSGITPELVRMMTDEPRIVNYLDMPLQHGSDRILRLMRRPERRATIRERVGWLRDAVPGITLRTTVIVGFPGEEERDFRELCDLLEELRLDRVGIFPYSPEEGTRAESMANRPDTAVVRDRMAELGELVREIEAECSEERVGDRALALVDGVGAGTLTARIEAQAIDVDGVTRVRLNGVSGDGAAVGCPAPGVSDSPAGKSGDGAAPASRTPGKGDLVPQEGDFVFRAGNFVPRSGESVPRRGDSTSPAGDFVEVTGDFAARAEGSVPGAGDFVEVVIEDAFDGDLLAHLAGTRGRRSRPRAR